MGYLSEGTIDSRGFFVFETLNDQPLSSMIVGLGIDLVEVCRFVAVLDRTPAVANRLFTVAERSLPAYRLAGRFAAKEAVAKALGAPPGLVWRDVEVLAADGSQPALAIRGTVAAAADRLGVRSWHLSLSHDGGLVVAVVVAES